jgi:prepilin peptidase CpaA
LILDIMGLHLGADWWAYVVLLAVLVPAAICDCRGGKIPNWITYGGIAAGLVGHMLVGGVTGNDRVMGFSDAAAGLAVGFLPLAAVWLAGGMGGGDAKLMGAIGALMGPRFALAGIFYGFAVAAIMAIFVIIKRRELRKTLARIGRFFYLSLLPGKKIDPATPDSAKIPIGMALAVGAGIELVEILLQGRSFKGLLGI